MSFSYAAFTVMMSEYTMEEAAALLEETGYGGVEWRVHNVSGTRKAGGDSLRGNKATIDLETIVEKAREVRKLAEKHDLDIVGLGAYVSYKHLNDVKRCLEAASIMGCGSVRVAAPKYDGSENYNDIFEEAVRGFTKVARLAREYGVRANVELHEDNICCSASLAYRLVSNFDPDNIGVILDPGNMIRQGYEGWQIGLELLGPYLSHVHVKNCAWLEDGVVDEVRQWKTSVVPMKEGFVKWRDVLTALDRVGFNGWLTLEDFSQGDTKSKLAEDLAYLKSVEAELRA
jgi:sugar phosphate isomerase/epimerase